MDNIVILKPVLWSEITYSLPNENIENIKFGQHFYGLDFVEQKKYLREWVEGIEFPKNEHNQHGI